MHMQNLSYRVSNHTLTFANSGDYFDKDDDKLDERLKYCVQREFQLTRWCLKRRMQYMSCSRSSNSTQAYASGRIGVLSRCHSHGDWNPQKRRTTPSFHDRTTSSGHSTWEFIYIFILNMSAKPTSSPKFIIDFYASTDPACLIHGIDDELNVVQWTRGAETVDHGYYALGVICRTEKGTRTGTCITDYGFGVQYQAGSWYLVLSLIESQSSTNPRIAWQ